MTLSIELSDVQERELAEIARRWNVRTEALVEAAVRDLIAHSGQNFEEISIQIIDKNRELYKRLS